VVVAGVRRRRHVIPQPKPRPCGRW
jgi:hypothetical protein